MAGNSISLPDILVTGGSSGIGLAACSALARGDASVVLTSRSLPRAQAAASRVSSRAAFAATALELDLEDMASIRRAAEELDRTDRGLRGIVHNSGAVYPRRKITPDGFEAQWSVTYLGPFLLTHLLLDRLRSTPGARIVNVASDLHRSGRLDLRDLSGTSARYGFVSAYARAELAKVLFTYELSRRLAPFGVSCSCVHPGGVRTRLFREFHGPMRWLIEASNLLKISPEKGARDIVRLALESDAMGSSGKYFRGGRDVRSSRATYDESVAAELYERTARLLGVQPIPR